MGLDTGPEEGVVLDGPAELAPLHLISNWGALITELKETVRVSHFHLFLLTGWLVFLGLGKLRKAARNRPKRGEGKDLMID